MQFDAERHERVIAMVRDGLVQHTSLETNAAEEAAFHIADWLDDLDALSELVRKDSWSQADVGRLKSVLIHVPAHICAAAKIVRGEPVEDKFQIGATLGDGVGTRAPGGKYT